MAVERRARIPLTRTRNSQIIGVDFLIRTCAFDVHFEINVAQRSSKNLFSTAPVISGYADHLGGLPAGARQ